MNKKITIILSIVVFVLCIGGLFVANKSSNEKKEEEEIKELFVDKETENAGDDILSSQTTVTEEIKKFEKDKQFTFNNPKIIKNPYKISPLTAIIIFTSNKEEEVQVYINNEFVTTMESSLTHTIPIYGLKANYKNIIKLKSESGKEKDFTIKTEEYYGDKIQVEKTSPKLNNDLYFSSGIGGTNLKAYDKQGNVRWYLEAPYAHDIEFLGNGHLLVSNGKYSSKSTTFTGLVEIDYLGKVYKYYDLEGGYHHEVVQTTKDSYIVASSNPKNDMVADYVVEIDKNTGKTIKVIDLLEIAKKIDPEFVKGFAPDWAWNNSIYFDEENQELLLSLRVRNSIMCLDYKTNEIKWIFGDKKNWSENFYKYLLIPTENTKYPNGQHSVFLDEEGNMGLFNNNFDPNSEEVTGGLLSAYINDYSSAILYEINGKSINQIWEYKGDQRYWSFAISNYNKTATGNHLVNFGWEFSQEAYNKNMTVRDYVDVTSATVFELDENDNVLFKAKIDNGAYRMYKHKMYKPKTKQVDIDNYSIINNKENSDIKEIKTDTIRENLLSAEFYDVSMELSQTFIQLNMAIEEQDEINILFVSEEDTTYQYTYKSIDSYPNTSVNLKLVGNYALYLQINGRYYDTGKIIKF